MESWRLRLFRAFRGDYLPVWVPYSLFMFLGLLLMLPLFIDASGFEAALKDTTLDRGK